MLRVLRARRIAEAEFTLSWKETEMSRRANPLIVTASAEQIEVPCGPQ